MKDMWKSGIMGVIIGDALGCPVQFESREQVRQNPVTGMVGYRTFNLPEGTWTDDSALTLALLDSIAGRGCIDCVNILDNFVRWLEDGEYTPFGFSFDIGRGTMNAIRKYERTNNPHTCGGHFPTDNGNGSIMRIMPAVLYCVQKGYDIGRAISIIHSVSSLTHAHERAKIACGLYYFMASHIVNDDGDLLTRLQAAVDDGFICYKVWGYDGELDYFRRLRKLSDFKTLTAESIKTSGYVVDTIEAAVWGLITTNTFKEALLKIVNLGGDTDSIGAVAGGMAGLYYGYDAIPAEWLNVIQRREWIEDMIKKVDE